MKDIRKFVNLREGQRIAPRREDETLAEWCQRYLEYRERQEPQDERERRTR
jgi:hypothetical protein